MFACGNGLGSEGDRDVVDWYFLLCLFYVLNNSALSVLHKGKLFHLLIEPAQGGVHFKDAAEVFPRLEDLIKFHCLHSAGKRQ